MNLQFIAVAEGATIDRATNRISLFNLMDEIAVPAFPVMIPTMAVANMISRDAGEEAVPVRLRITLNEQNLLLTDIQLDFQGHLRTRGVVMIQGLIIQQPGNCVVDILFGDNVAGTWTIPVQAVGQPHPNPYP